MVFGKAFNKGRVVPRKNSGLLCCSASLSGAERTKGRLFCSPPSCQGGLSFFLLDLQSMQQSSVVSLGNLRGDPFSSVLGRGRVPAVRAKGVGGVCSVASAFTGTQRRQQRQCRRRKERRSFHRATNSGERWHFPFTALGHYQRCAPPPVYESAVPFGVPSM
jgi:hypothetical protein